MEYSVTVTNPVNQVAWKQVVTAHGYEDIERRLQDSARVVNIVEALFYPVRTNEHFAGDLFFPTCTNQVPRITNIIARNILGLVALVVDIASLPLRLATTFPRVFSTKSKEENLFYRYLLDNGAPDDLLSCVSVQVELEKKIETMDKDRYGRDVKHVEDSHESRKIYFIDVPDYDGALASGHSCHSSDIPQQPMPRTNSSP